MKFDLRDFKKFITNNYPKYHPLQVVNEEPDFIDDPKIMLGKAEIWLRLSNWKRP